MTLRRGTQEVLAARMVPVGEPGWQDVLDVLTEAAKLASPLIVDPLHRLLTSLDLAPRVPVGSWVVLDDGRLLSVAEDAWVEKHCPEVVKSAQKPPKPPKRCLWVWWDDRAGWWRQCDRPKSEPHAHAEPGAVPVRPWRYDGRRCLGVWVGGRYDQPPELEQCESLRDACGLTHSFVAKTRLEETP